MKRILRKNILLFLLALLAIYLIDSLADSTWHLSYNTLRTYLLLVLIVVPTFFAQNLRGKKWLMSALFAVLWTVSFPLLAYVMGENFALVRAFLMGGVGFLYSFFLQRRRG